MPLKKEVALVWVICLSCKVVLTGCEVVLVNRNVTDSFRVGKDGCTKNKNVCTNYSPSCQLDGQCLCPASEPNFQNPTASKYYGCSSSEAVRAGIGGSRHCRFGPFQLIPSTRQQDSSSTQFTDLDDPNRNLSSCSFQRAEAKFPNNATEMKLQWLNESYVELIIMDGKTLHFQWNKSVPGLRGTIITLNFYCISRGRSSVSIFPTCLRAKIFGTWPQGNENPSSLTSAKPVTTSSTQSTKSMASDEGATPQTSVTTSSPESTSSSKSRSKEECSESNTLIPVLVALLAISLFVIVVLGIFVGFLWKKVQRTKNKNLEMTEIQNIENQKRRYSENGVHNDGIYEESFPQSRHNNSSLSDHKYEEPSNYEPLRKNHIQDQGDEHNYQSLTTSQKEK